MMQNDAKKGISMAQNGPVISGYEKRAEITLFG
jgi:hypothetical protein